MFFAAVRNIKYGSLRIETPNGGPFEAQGREPGPSGVLQVLGESFYRRVIAGGEVGFGEAYQDGLCDSPDLVELLRLALVNRQAVDLNQGAMRLLSKWKNLRLHRSRANTVAQSKDNIHAHYDLGNAFFSLFLDETMTYSSAVYEHEGQALADAQRNKYRRICDLAGLTASDDVLEIGTGWGGFAMFAAGEYGCRVTTITISREQFALASERVAEAGLNWGPTIMSTISGMRSPVWGSAG